MRALRKQKDLEHCLGFTLMELMLVIAVVGILAVVAVPKYSAMTNRYHLESSAQQVAGSLRYAKQLAMDQRKYIAVVFNQGSVQNYEVKVDGSGGLLSANAIGETVRFDSGVVFASGQGLNTSDLVPGPYTFFSNKGFLGTVSGSDPASPVNIFLGKAGGTISIQIVPQTGYVTIN
ncbi:MAG: pilus assembly FimT family protein [Desulfitobacteriaceae bacterium]